MYAISRVEVILHKLWKYWISNITDMNPGSLKIKGWFKGQFPENFGKIKGCWTLNDFKLSLISDTECNISTTEIDTVLDFLQDPLA